MVKTLRPKFAPHRQFTREEWASLRADTPLTLDESYRLAHLPLLAIDWRLERAPTLSPKDTQGVSLNQAEVFD